MEYTLQDVRSLLQNAYSLYVRLDAYIMDHYNVEQIWSDGGKYGKICLCYKRNGKSLCTLYMRPGELAVWVVMGKEERERFEQKKEEFSAAIVQKYDDTPVLHDGKWLAFNVKDDALFEDLIRLLAVKKEPNRKLTMCGYCCDMCKAYSANVRKKDERVDLAAYWKRYFDLDIPAENIRCDGCRCKRKDGVRLDGDCPVRACVQEKKLEDCAACEQYPCNTFRMREGLSYEEAFDIAPLSIPAYNTYIGAFDNRSRLDRKKKG